MKITSLFTLLLMLGWPLAWGESVPTAQVQTQPLTTHTMTQTLTAYGLVAGQPAQIINLSRAIGGRIDTILVNPGQAVKKGQPLLRIDIDPASHLAFTQAENAVTYAKRDLERQQTLLAQQLATHAQIDAAAHAVRDAEQALATQRTLGAADSTMVLVAPQAGMVTSVAVSPGDRVAAGAVLVQLVVNNAVQARLAVLPEEASRIHAGMKVHLTAVFEPAHSSEGVIELVANQVDPISQRVDVIVTLSTSTLSPGTRVKGTITISQRNATAVPRSALLHDEHGAYVFQVVGAKAHRVTVNSAEESQGMVAVSGALVTESPVVILGNYELQDGMSVREATP